LPVLQVNSRSIDQKSGEIWTSQADLQPISFKSDRLLAYPSSELCQWRPSERIPVWERLSNGRLSYPIDGWAGVATWFLPPRLAA